MEQTAHDTKGHRPAREERAPIETLTLPYARHAVAQGSTSPALIAVEFAPAVTRALTEVTRTAELGLIAAASAAFVARLSGQVAVPLGYRTGDLASAEAEPPVWPFSLRVETTQSFADLSALAVQTLGGLRIRDSHARTLIARELRALAAEALPYSPELDGDLDDAELLVGAGFSLARSPQRSWYVVYDSALLPASSALQFARQLAAFTAQLFAQSARPLLEVALLDDAERARVLGHWNATQIALDDGLVLPSAFAAQVARTPHAPALAFRDSELSYAELAERVARLAGRLRALGVGPEVRVGVYCERSVEMVVAVLSVLHAGGAYVPLDPSFPADRVRFMIDDTEMRVVIAQGHLHARIAESSATLVDVLDDHDGVYPPFDHGLRPDHLAYVLFTSGSTGRPKGVMVEHRNVNNLFAAMDEHLAHARPGVWLSVTSLSFDISVVELLWSLCRGFKVVLYREPSRDGSDHPEPSFAALAQKHAVTHLQCTPTMAHMFLADPAARTELQRLREIILAGEAYPIALARQLRTYTSATLRNIYGPTETTVYSVGQLVDPQSDSVPIGRPLGNTEVYVLDAQRKPVPVGVPGELYIGGRGVTRGYLGRPDLTAQRFVADPFSARPGARLYRTGDLVRFRDDGTLDFLGRIDHQVKIRGYRIELGEIENALSAHPAVREGVVTVREDIPGNKRLVAYVVLRDSRDGGEPQVRAELKEHLKQSLPSYMVPANFAFLEAFPQTTSGKVDRKALPPPEALRAVRRPQPTLSASV